MKRVFKLYCQPYLLLYELEETYGTRSGNFPYSLNNTYGDLLLNVHLPLGSNAVTIKGMM